MTTAIDSNVLIDLIGPKTSFTAAAIAALDAARLDGALIVCPVLVAEISAHFPTAGALASALGHMQIVIREFSVAALHLAGSAFFRYRQRSAKPKPRMLADFLVRAHAHQEADVLLTRDRGYYRTYFPSLKIVDA
ncbi:MAG TPA: type II toxin-antitoxin system VapC family toxin [Verrucomicrobiales bacterium]|nr:type II toxin-antitoxin system VapC family toxin [Verrucomicrobiales bacterium]